MQQLQMGDIYPFGQGTQREVVVRQDLTPSKEILDRIKLMEMLQCSNLISMKGWQWRSSTVCVFYQYVPIRLGTWILNINEHMLLTIKNALYDLALFLTKHSLEVTFRRESIGIDVDYKLKYFMGVDFCLSRQGALLDNYIQQIEKLFQNDGKGLFEEDKSSEEGRNNKNATEDKLLQKRIVVLRNHLKEIKSRIPQKERIGVSPTHIRYTTMMSKQTNDSVNGQESSPCSSLERSQFKAKSFSPVNSQTKIRYKPALMREYSGDLWTILDNKGQKEESKQQKEDNFQRTVTSLKSNISREKKETKDINEIVSAVVRNSQKMIGGLKRVDNVGGDDKNRSEKQSKQYNRIRILNKGDRLQ